MYPDDRVMVAVINRKCDLWHLQQGGWYRIPQARMPDGVHAEYLAFFLSGPAVLKGQPSGVYYYAGCRGVELLYRRDLLPDEPDHPRAGDAYYRVALDDVIERQPPLLNRHRRSVSFIHTTGDRFAAALDVADLYSDSPEYVARVYHPRRSVIRDRLLADHRLLLIQ